MKFSIYELIGVVGGSLIQGKKDRNIKGVSINSKIVKSGDLFVAIKGNRFDGHNFINAAVRKGAAAVVVSKKVKVASSCIPVIYVDDTVKALGRIARAHRDRFDIDVIAITGSAGKTTTKDMVSSVLSSKYKVLKNIGTCNNHIGLPMTLMKLHKGHDIAVVELGTNQPGDIKWLTFIANPNIAIMTNVGESHLELLKSPSRVFSEKLNLVKGMKKGSTVIVNKDDRFLKKVASYNKKYKVIMYGINELCKYRAREIEVVNNCKLSFKISKTNILLNTPVVSNAYNALAAFICGRLFNIGYNNISSNINKARFSGNRYSVKRIVGHYVVDDTYNANPVSVRGALETFSVLKTRGRKIFVFADMLELGKASRCLHSEIGRLAANYSIDRILTFGKHSKYCSEAANKQVKNKIACHFNSLSSMHKMLLSYMKTGDAVLVKGSRSMCMERTTSFLKENLK